MGDQLSGLSNQGNMLFELLSCSFSLEKLVPITNDCTLSDINLSLLEHPESLNRLLLVKN